MALSSLPPLFVQAEGKKVCFHVLLRAKRREGRREIEEGDDACPKERERREVEREDEVCVRKREKGDRKGR